MRIRYKKKRLYINLFLGLIWLVYGVVNAVLSDSADWFDYSWFLLSGFYLTLYFYQRKEHYLTIESGIIKQNWPFGKELNLDEVKQIKFFAGDYILKTDTEELSINSQLINSESLTVLNEELAKLEIGWS